MPRGLNNLEKADVAPPVFTHETKASQRKYSKSIGDTFKVSCEALGSPEPDIFWFKDGQHTDEYVYSQRGRSIVEFQIMGPADSGDYSCRARNMFGEQIKTYKLEVKQPSGSMNAIVTEAGPANSTVLEGETATLQCRVKSLNTPHLKWLKRLEPNEITEMYDTNNENTLNVGHERYRVLDTNQDVPTGNDEYLNKLVLTNTEPSDSGLYICFVTNSGFGAFTYKSMNLRVLERSKVNLHGDGVQEIPGNKNDNSETIDDNQRHKSLMILTIVISLAIIVVGLLTVIICCFMRKNQDQKETSAPLSSGNTSHYSGRSDSPDMQKPFMLDNANVNQQSVPAQGDNLLHPPNPKYFLANLPMGSGQEIKSLKHQAQLPLPPIPSNLSSNTLWNSRNNLVYPQGSALLMMSNQPYQKHGYTDSGFADNSKDYEETSAVNSGSTVVGGNQYEVPYSHHLVGPESQKQYQRSQQQYFARHFPRVSNMNVQPTMTLSSTRSELTKPVQQPPYSFRTQYNPTTATRKHLSDYESQ